MLGAANGFARSCRDPRGWTTCVIPPRKGWKALFVFVGFLAMGLSFAFLALVIGSSRLERVTAEDKSEQHS